MMRRILYIESEGRKLAIINCCENEFSVATESTAGSNPLLPIQQFYKIQEAKENADYVLVIVHGGIEHYQLPTSRMIETYRFFIDAGADAVVNHHQHCYSGYERYKSKPIIYGLGNLLFDNPNCRNGIWNDGYMVELNFEAEEIEFSLHPYTQCNEEPTIRLMTENQKNQFERSIEELNCTIASPVEINKALWMHILRK
ncbi:CapA family protein [Bacteroides ovatus]|nr:CapA family protein [Bacteroides ovatus]